MIISTHLKLAILLISIALTVIMPDMAFALVESIVVGLFELLEFTLDEIIEHFFHTSRHTTQVIVFYIMSGMFVYGVYRLFFYLKKLYLNAKVLFPDWWLQQRVQVMAAWQTLTFGKKVKMISGCSLGVACFAVLVL